MDIDGLGGRILRLNKLGGNGVPEGVLPLESLSCEDELDEYVRGWGFLSEMARSPEWNKVEYSTPVAQSFAMSQDIVEAYLKSEGARLQGDD